MEFLRTALSDLERSFAPAAELSRQYASVHRALLSTHDHLWYNRELVKSAADTSLIEYLDQLLTMVNIGSKRMSTVNDADRILTEYRVKILGLVSNIILLFIKSYKDRVVRYAPALLTAQTKYANYTRFLPAHTGWEGCYFHDLRKDVHTANMRLWRALSELTTDFSADAIVACIKTAAAMLDEEAHDISGQKTGDLPELAVQIDMLQSCGHIITAVFDAYESRLRAALKAPDLNLQYITKFAEEKKANVKVSIYTCMILHRVSYIENDLAYLKTALLTTRQHEPINNDSIRLAFIAGLIIHNYITNKMLSVSIFTDNDIPGLLVTHLKSIVRHFSGEWAAKAVRTYMLNINALADRSKVFLDACERRGSNEIVAAIEHDLVPKEPSLTKYVSAYRALRMPSPAPTAIPYATPAITCSHCRNFMFAPPATQYLKCPYCHTTLRLY
jgi:LSD1 subclass zinc finger protein